jgi:hypothetical protein
VPRALVAAHSSSGRCPPHRVSRGTLARGESHYPGRLGTPPNVRGIQRESRDQAATMDGAEADAISPARAATGAPPKGFLLGERSEPARNRAHRSRCAPTAAVTAGTMPQRSSMRGGPASPSGSEEGSRSGAAGGTARVRGSISGPRSRFSNRMDSARHAATRRRANTSARVHVDVQRPRPRPWTPMRSGHPASECVEDSAVPRGTHGELHRPARDHDRSLLVR